MIATVDKKQYRLSVDCVLDQAGRLWQARDVFQGNDGEIDLILDTNPYADRLTCYSVRGRWEVYAANGTPTKIVDQNILEYLVELCAAIPGVPQ